MQRRFINLYYALRANSKFHSSATTYFPTSQTHSRDAYNKDVDTTPPEDSTTYIVDPEADVQKSTSPPSGEFSRAGTLTSEYENVDTTSQPYAAPDVDALAAKDKDSKTKKDPGSGRKPGKKND